jgi:hypothetical protein
LTFGLKKTEPGGSGRIGDLTRIGLHCYRFARSAGVMTRSFVTIWPAAHLISRSETSRGGNMKRLALLLAVVLCSTALLQAGDKDQKDDGKGKMMSMTGMVCNEKCVATTANKSSCKADCSETGGNLAFVDSKGKLFKIDNQDAAMPMAGKKVKVKCQMADNGMMHIYEIAPVTY